MQVRVPLIEGVCEACSEPIPQRAQGSKLLVHRYRKWLALAQDDETGSKIREGLRACYYNLAIGRLYHLSLHGPLEKIVEVRRMGDSCSMILSTLLSRGASKVSRAFRGQRA